MTRICIVGDSHIGPLKTAHVQELFPSDSVAKFFAAHISVMNSICFDGKFLTPGSPDLSAAFKATSRGSEFIDISEYDQFVIVGLGFSMFRTAMSYFHYTTDTMTAPPPGKYMLSHACFLKMIENRTSDCLSLKISRHIRNHSQARITVISAPNPGFGLPKERIAKGSPPYHNISDNGDDIILADLFRETCLRIGQKFKVDTVPPIAAVALNGVFNRREFSLLPAEISPDVSVDYNNEMVHAGGEYFRVLSNHLFGT